MYIGSGCGPLYERPTMRKLLSSIAVAVAVMVSAPSIALAASPTETSPATAASSSSSDSLYVFWSEWSTTGSGAWKYSQTGAQSVTPANGTAVGYRWGVGSSATISEPPRVEGSFSAICGTNPAPSGQKKVAVVIDFGTASEAPQGTTPPQMQSQCATVPTSSSALQTLTSVTSVRQDPNGLVCGIGGYPPSGCGFQITAAQLQSGGSSSSAPASTSSSSNGWVPFAIGAVVIIIIVIAGVLIARRRRT